MDLTPPENFNFDPRLFDAGRFWARQIHGQSEADRIAQLNSQLSHRLNTMPLIGSKHFKTRITGGDGTDLSPMYRRKAATQQTPLGAHTRIGVILYDRGPNPVFAPKPGMSRAADNVAEALAKQGIKRVPTLTEDELREIEGEQEYGGSSVLDPMTLPEPSYEAAKQCGASFAKIAIDDARSQAISRKQRHEWHRQNW